MITKKKKYIHPETTVLLPELKEPIGYETNGSEGGEQWAKHGTFNLWGDEPTDGNAATPTGDGDPWSKDFDDYFK